MGDFLMPSLGADMDAGAIVEWLVGPGDEVHRGDVVAVVETDKADIEVEVFEDGVVEELLLEPGVEVPVGAPLARLRPTGTAAEAGEPAVERAAETEGAVAPPPGPTAEEPAPVPATPAAGGEGRRASPRARRLAAATGVDLTALAGTGPGGAVVGADVAAVAGPAPTGEAGRDRSAGMRAAIGGLMARSAREIPHYHLASTIDLRPALDWLTARNADRPVTGRVLPAALLLRAVALAAREVPEVNGTWEDGFRPADHVHLGVAVALRGGGLVAPVLADVDRMGLDQTMAALADLVGRARRGRLRGQEVGGGTLTVTNLGDTGADEVFGLIHPPQVALVGFGRIVERPWAADGMLGVHPTVRATLAADHRVSDGRDGSRFLATVDRLLQHPEDL